MSLLGNKDAFVHVHDSIEKVFSRSEKYTFLAGAGISIDAPSSIPSAREIVRAMLGLCAPAEEIDSLLALRMLRYELVVEKIQNTLDPDLHFLDYLDLVKEPNLIHHFLARAMIHEKCNVVTTNFDHAIEMALKECIGDNDTSIITPVITKQDFTAFRRPLDLFKAGKLPVYKIHGAKRNAITNQDTTSSLVTTIGALGKDRSSTETFAIESYKKHAVFNLTKRRTLVVMGYSGSDDFDIGPTLRMIPYLFRIIWIEHAELDEPQVKVFNKLGWKGDPATLPRLERLLAEMGGKITGSPVLIRGRTTDIVKRGLWKTLLPGVPVPGTMAHPVQPASRPPFKDWITNEFKDRTVPDLTKYTVACSIYSDLNDYKSVARVAEKGTRLATEIMDLAAISYFANQGGIVFLHKEEYGMAREMFTNCVAVAPTPFKRAIAETNLALAKIKQSQRGGNDELDEARSLLKEAMRMFESYQDQWGKVACINNLAEIDLVQDKLTDGITLLLEAYMSIIQLGNLEFKATLSNNIGVIFGALGNNHDAVAKLLECSAIRQELGDNSGAGRVALNIGLRHEAFGEDAEAIATYTGALSHVRAVEDKRMEARLSVALSRVHYFKGSIDDAIASITGVIDCWKDIKNDDTAAEAFLVAGYYAVLKKDMDGAKKHYENASQLFTSRGWGSRAARANHLATLLGNLPPAGSKHVLESLIPHLSDESRGKNDPQKIIDDNLTAVAGKEDKLPPLKLASIAIDNGIANLHLGQLDNARSLLEQGMFLLLVANKKEKAIAVHDDAWLSGLPIFPVETISYQYDFITRDDLEIAPRDAEWLPSRDTMRMFHEATALFEKGFTEMNGGNHAAAIDHFERAEKLYDALHRNDMVDTIKEAIMSLKLSSGKVSTEEWLKGLQSEIEQLQEHVKIHLSAGDIGALDKDYERISRILHTIGQDEQAKAIDAIREGLSGNLKSAPAKKGIIDADATNDAQKSDLVLAAEKLMALQNESKDPVQMLERDHDDNYIETLYKFNMILTMLAKKQDIATMVDIRLKIADFLVAGREYNAARPQFEEAYYSGIVLGNELLQARAAAGLANLPQTGDVQDDALDKFEFALRVFEEKGELFGRVMALAGSGVIYHRRNDLDEALSRFQECIDIADESDATQYTWKAFSLVQEGEILSKTGDDDGAYMAFINAYNLYTSQIDEKTGQSKDLNSIAQICIKIAVLSEKSGDIQDAINNLNEASNIYAHLGNQGKVQALTPLIANLETQNADPVASALNDLKNIEWQAKSNPIGAATRAEKLAQTFIELGRVADAITTGVRAGELYFQEHHFFQAERSFRQAKNTAERSGDGRLESILQALASLDSALSVPRNKSAYLSALAAHLHATGNTAIAIENYRESIKISTDANDEARVAETWAALAKIYQGQNKLDDALDAYKHALSVHETRHDENGKAEVLFRLGSVAMLAKHADDALKYYDQCIAVARATSNIHWLANARCEKGVIFMNAGQRVMAIDEFTESRSLFHQAKNSTGVIKCNVNLGDLEAAASNVERALEHYQLALESATELSNWPWAAAASESSGKLLKQQKRFEEAIDAFQKAKDFHAKAGNETGKENMLFQIGVSHDNACQYDKALTFYLESLALARANGNKYGIMATAFNAGLIYFYDRDIARSEPLINEATAVAEKHDIKQYKGSFYFQVAEIAARKGNFDLAIVTLARAESCFRELDDNEMVISTLARVAEVLAERGSSVEASVKIHEARRVASETGYALSQADILLAEGTLFEHQGNFKGAIDAFMNARDIYQADDKQYYVAEALERLARVYKKNGEQQKSADSLQGAMDRFARMGLNARAVSCK